MTRPAQILKAALLAGLMGLAAPVAAQETAPATLIADNIQFDGTQNVIATGSVEVFFNGNRLRAQSISYNSTTDQLEVTGPLSLSDESGDTVIVAEFAQLDADLQNGVLQSARLVLDRQLQIAATEIVQTNGRYTQVYQGVASSCEVCQDNPRPLWEIRAGRIIHDAEEQQLYFHNATLRILGVPVAYLPRMRLPDPTLERANGFLRPELRLNEDTGNQIRVPYFLMLGDHADLTVTPWIGSGGQTLELRYRQAFTNGTLVANGAFTRDDLIEDATRGYMLANANFGLSRGYRLTLQAQLVSDSTYRDDYGFPNPAVLESLAEISRTRRDEYIEAAAIVYEETRRFEDGTIQPSRVLRAEITRRYTGLPIGGTLTAGLEGIALYRFSDTDGDDGRDLFRVSGDLNWSRTEILGGLVTTFEAGMSGSAYTVDQDTRFIDTVYRYTPSAAVTLRYPLQATSPAGVRHVIEPVAQFVWSDTYGDAVPNEDSGFAEFDEGNLFSLNRLPGADEAETGARANLGLSYSRTAPSGLTLGIAGGVVLRAEDGDRFTNASGLSGTRSDYLVATHVGLRGNLNLINRSLFDSDFSFTASETSLLWTGDRHRVTSTYSFLAADETKQRDDPVEELIFDGNYRLRSGWQAGLGFRYDFVEEQPIRSNLSLGYENECIDVELSVSQRFGRFDRPDPSPTFGVTVSLAGFGAGREGRSTARSCRG